MTISNIFIIIIVIILIAIIIAIIYLIIKRKTIEDFTTVVKYTNKDEINISVVDILKNIYKLDNGNENYTYFQYFYYTGNIQEYEIPDDIVSLTFHCWGGGGGGSVYKYSLSTPYAMFFSSDYRQDIVTRRWIIPDTSGYNRGNIETTGTITLNQGQRGFGAKGRGITSISGNTTASIEFPEGIIPENFTILSLTRYASDNNKNLVLKSRNGDWYHGHQGGKAGICNYYGIKTGTEGVSIANIKNWVTCIGKNEIRSSNIANNILVNGKAKANADGGSGGNTYRLGINNGSGDKSDWAMSFVIIWDKHLTDIQMKFVDDIVYDYILTGVINKDDFIDKLRSIGGSGGYVKATLTDLANYKTANGNRLKVLVGQGGKARGTRAPTDEFIYGGGGLSVSINDDFELGSGGGCSGIFSSSEFVVDDKGVVGGRSKPLVVAGGGGGAGFDIKPIIEFEKTFINNYLNSLIIQPNITPTNISGTDDVYIRFINNGSIKFNIPFVCDFLLVGGGGGGNTGGGGGGGEVIYRTDIDVNEGIYDIRIGEGGISDSDGEKTSINFNNTGEILYEARGGLKGNSDAGDGGANGNTSLRGGAGSTAEVEQLRRLVGGGGAGANGRGGNITYTRNDNPVYINLESQINRLTDDINANPISTSISFTALGDDAYYLFDRAGTYNLVFNNDYLIDMSVVGGGGGGGSGGNIGKLLGAGGGGGGGQVITRNDTYVLKNTKYVITVGEGGRGGIAPTREAGNNANVNGGKGGNTDVFVEVTRRVQTGTRYRRFRADEPIYGEVKENELLLRAEGGGGGAGCISYSQPNNGIGGGGGNIIGVEEDYIVSSTIRYGNNDLGNLTKVFNFKFDKINTYNNFFGITNVRLSNTNNTHELTDDNPKGIGSHGSLRITSALDSYTLPSIYGNIEMNRFISLTRNQNVSFSFWVKMSGVSRPYNRLLFIGKRNCNKPEYFDNRLQIRTNADLSSLSFDIVVNNAFNTFTYNHNMYNDNWYFIAWSIEANGNWKIYINKTLVFIGVKVKFPSLSSNLSIVVIGGDCHSGVYNFVGNIFDFRFYTGIYTQDNINYLYDYSIYVDNVMNKRTYVSGGIGGTGFDNTKGGDGYTRTGDSGYISGGAGGGSGATNGENGIVERGGNGGSPISGFGNIGSGGGGGAVVINTGKGYSVMGGYGNEGGGNGGGYNADITTSINGTNAISIGGGGGGASGYLNNTTASGGNGFNGMIFILIRGYLTIQANRRRSLEVLKEEISRTYRYLYTNITSGAGGNSVATNIIGTSANPSNLYVGAGGSGGAQTGYSIGQVNADSGGSGNTGENRGMNGRANTGGGGGGGGVGGTGGSGLVIIRIKDYRPFYYVNQESSVAYVLHGGNGGSNIAMDGNGNNDINGKGGRGTVGGLQGLTNDIKPSGINYDGALYTGGSGFKNHSGGGGGYNGGGSGGNVYDDVTDNLLQVGGGGGGSSYVNTQDFSFNTGDGEIIDTYYHLNGSLVVAGNTSDYYYNEIGVGGYYNKDGGNGVVVIEYSKLELVGDIASASDAREDCRTSAFNKLPLNIIDISRVNADRSMEDGGFKHRYISSYNGEDITTEITYSSYITEEADKSPIYLFDGADTYGYFGNGTTNRYNSTTNNGDYLSTSSSKYPHNSIPERGEWIKIRLHKAIVVKKYEIQSKREYLHRAPGKWALYGIDETGNATLIHKMETRMTASDKYKDYYSKVLGSENLLSCIIYKCDNTIEYRTYVFVFTALAKKYSKREDYRDGGILSFVNLSIYETTRPNILTTSIS